MDLQDQYRKESGFSIGTIHDIGTTYYSNDYVEWLEAKINFTDSSLQLRKESKSFLNIKTIADLIRLYPEQSSYGIKCDKEYIHFSVNNKVVLTKALIV